MSRARALCRPAGAVATTAIAPAVHRAGRVLAEVAAVVLPLGSVTPTHLVRALHHTLLRSPPLRDSPVAQRQTPMRETSPPTCSSGSPFLVDPADGDAVVHHVDLRRLDPERGQRG